MTKRLASIAALNLALLVTGAVAEPWVKKFDPPAGGYTEDKPAYAYFKEITVTRKSTRDLDFDITLQGPIAKNLPKDYGINYYVYFDLEDHFTHSSKRQEGFQNDNWVQIYIEPNSPTSKNLKIYVTDLVFRSKKWTFDVTQLHALNDKISFSIKSNLFNEKDIPTRLRIAASMLHWEGGNTSKYTEKKNDGTHFTEPFDLPTKSSP